jgi:predicted kinase
VSGPAGCGKTTLAHRLAQSLACPAICRDEIKEGMARAARGFEPAPGDELTQRTLAVFFEVLRLLLEARVTVVAEAAFQDQTWTPGLQRLGDLAEVRIVQCHTDPATARRRIAERAGTRSAHADDVLLADLETGDRYFSEFAGVAFEAPTIDVDTTAGYLPAIEQLVDFIESGGGQ